MPSLEEKTSVFDLPNIRFRPSFRVLEETLQALEIKPASWEQKAKIWQPTGGSDETGISRYLTGIISCSFEWFDATENGDVNEKREILWDLASKRVTERCGRSAMGELNREWVIPASDNVPELKFEIREPPLTGDNLGLKTWGTAYAIAKKLEYIGTHFLHDVLQLGQTTETADAISARVLELGAGTGLVGLAAAAIWSTNVLLTDLAEIQSNLHFNIVENLKTVAARDGKIANHVLDWKSEDGLANYPTQDFDVVIAADSLYDDEHPQLVANMIKKYLKQGHKSRTLVAVPLRDDNTIRMAAELKSYLEAHGLELLHEGWEVCADDWEKESDEEPVQSWWGIFGFC